VEKLRAQFFVIPGMTVNTQSNFAERAIYLRLAHPNYTTNETLIYDEFSEESFKKLLEFYEVAKHGRETTLDSGSDQEAWSLNSYGEE
jgi:hypothetical protein